MVISYDSVPGLQADMERVNLYLRKFCSSSNPSMQKVLDWIIAGNSKQIRPLFTILCSRLGGNRPDVAEHAALVETCHTASLIHDDIVDDSDHRRGRLSVQKMFGKEMAVYSGDYLIFSAIRNTKLSTKPWYRDMFDRLEVMCDGEICQYDHRYDTSLTEQDYIEIVLGKTSAMFEIACGVGIYESNGNSELKKNILSFAKNFGLFFQLRDDYMDFFVADSKGLMCSDFCSGYYTLPVLHCFPNNPLLKEYAVSAKEKWLNTDDRESIKELITKNGGFTYARDKIIKYASRTKDALSSVADSPEKRKLIEIVDVLEEDIKKSARRI